MNKIEKINVKINVAITIIGALSGILIILAINWFSLEEQIMQTDIRINRLIEEISEFENGEIMIRNAFDGSGVEMPEYNEEEEKFEPYVH